MDQTLLPTSPQVMKPAVNPKGPCHLMDCALTHTSFTSSLPALKAVPILMLQQNTRRPRDQCLA